MIVRSSGLEARVLDASLTWNFHYDPLGLQDCFMANSKGSRR
jgi:hypothetical protein